MGRMTTAATRSLEIAVEGFRRRGGSASESWSAPPPAPVAPTRNPTRRALPQDECRDPMNRHLPPTGFSHRARLRRPEVLPRARTARQIDESSSRPARSPRAPALPDGARRTGSRPPPGQTQRPPPSPGRGAASDRHIPGRRRAGRVLDPGPGVGVRHAHLAFEAIGITEEDTEDGAEVGDKGIGRTLRDIRRSRISSNASSEAACSPRWSRRPPDRTWVSVVRPRYFPATSNTLSSAAFADAYERQHGHARSPVADHPPWRRRPHGRTRRVGRCRW